MPADIDERLRDYAARWRASQPVPPGIVDLAVGGEAVRRRWSALAVAASVIVVAVIAGGTLLLSRHSDPRQREQAGGIVPWNPVGQRLDTAGVSTARPIGAPAGVRLCSSADFTVVFGRTAIAPDALAGWLNTSFVLRSTAQSQCAVSAYGIDVELVDANGGPLPDDVVPPHGPPPFPSMLLVRPGQFVFGAVSWAWYDGRAPRPARLVIDPRGESADSPLIVSLAGVSIPPHPLNPSNLGP